jgi:hypothetical protein
LLTSGSDGIGASRQTALKIGYIGIHHQGDKM